MRIRRGIQVGAAALVAGTALAFPLAGSAWAPNGHPWKTKVPFTETVFDASTNESVTLTGTEALSIRVTGNVILGWNETVTAKLQRTIGVGAISGGIYHVKGSTTLNAQTPPGPPTHPVTFPASFVLHPPSPCRANHPPGPCFNPTSVLVPATVTLNPDGAVGSVQVGHSN